MIIMINKSNLNKYIPLNSNVYLTFIKKDSLMFDKSNEKFLNQNHIQQNKNKQNHY